MSKRRDLLRGPRGVVAVCFALALVPATLWGAEISREILADIRDDLRVLFAKEGRTPHILLSYSSLRFNHGTRKYTVHEKEEDGSWSQTASETIGPLSTGITFRVMIMNIPASSTNLTRGVVMKQPYWTHRAKAFPFESGQESLVMRLSHGDAANTNLLQGIERIIKAHADASLTNSFTAKPDVQKSKL